MAKNDVQNAADLKKQEPDMSWLESFSVVDDYMNAALGKGLLQTSAEGVIPGLPLVMGLQRLLRNSSYAKENTGSNVVPGKVDTNNVKGEPTLPNAKAGAKGVNAKTGVVNYKANPALAGIMARLEELAGTKTDRGALNTAKVKTDLQREEVEKDSLKSSKDYQPGASKGLDAIAALLGAIGTAGAGLIGHEGLIDATGKLNKVSQDTTEGRYMRDVKKGGTAYATPLNVSGEGVKRIGDRVHSIQENDQKRLDEVNKISTELALQETELDKTDLNRTLQTMASMGDMAGAESGRVLQAAIASKANEVQLRIANLQASLEKDKNNVSLAKELEHEMNALKHWADASQVIQGLENQAMGQGVANYGANRFGLFTKPNNITVTGHK